MNRNPNGFHRKLMCIEYPGIVVNVDKMMVTLGGIEEISRVYSAKNRRLELRFRPDDVHCKPACGDRYKSNGFLLKVKLKTIKSESGVPIKVMKDYEVVGHVDLSFKFKSVCDFQFLPMTKGPSGHLESIVSHLLPERLDEDHLNQWLESPSEHFLPPAAFSRVDSISLLNSYMYRKDGKASADVTEGSVIGRTRKRRSGHAIFVSFDIPTVPTKPRDKALKFLELKFLNGDKLEVMRKHFEERPIWSKLALMCVTNFQNDHLKYLLPGVAYYFVTGPFRVMWVRFGYDPRSDPTSRIYQTLDYRIRAPAGLMGLVKTKRRYANYLLPSKSSHQAAKNIVITKELLSQTEPKNVDSKQDVIPEPPLKKTSYLFLPSALPPARQMFYQYCDVKAPEIELMLSRLPRIPPNTKCDPRQGWLPLGFDVQCRDIINNHVIILLKKEAAMVESTTSAKEEETPVDDLTDDEHWEEEFVEEEIDVSDED